MAVTRTAVIGAAGQLGSDLSLLLGAACVPIGHGELELTNPASIAAALSAQSLGCVINCVAYNWVDTAESEPAAAFAVNAFGVRHLAQWCAAHDVPLLHVSTDHVFGRSGNQQCPWRETDLPAPVSVYAASKLAGEHFVGALCPRHWIVRTCGLYGRHAARGKGNFVETMLRLAGERPELRVVADQHCTPTSTVDLAQALLALAATTAYGTYHVTNAGECSWYEFAQEIFRVTGTPTVVQPIPSSEFAAPARRPAYSVLDVSKFEQTTGLTPRPWQAALAEYCESRRTS